MNRERISNERELELRRINSTRWDSIVNMVGQIWKGHSFSELIQTGLWHRTGCHGYLLTALLISMTTRTESAIVMGLGWSERSQSMPGNILGSAGHCSMCVCAETTSQNWPRYVFALDVFASQPRQYQCTHSLYIVLTFLSASKNATKLRHKN